MCRLEDGIKMDHKGTYRLLAFGVNSSGFRTVPAERG